jgi:hypothetical protein
LCSIDTAVNSVEECVDRLLGLLEPFLRLPDAVGMVLK